MECNCLAFSVSWRNTSTTRRRYVVNSVLKNETRVASGTTEGATVIQLTLTNIVIQKTHYKLRIMFGRKFTTYEVATGSPTSPRPREQGNQSGTNGP